MIFQIELDKSWERRSGWYERFKNEIRLNFAPVKMEATLLVHVLEFYSLSSIPVQLSISLFCLDRKFGTREAEATYQAESQRWGIVKSGWPRSQCVAKTTFDSGQSTNWLCPIDSSENCGMGVKTIGRTSRARRAKRGNTQKCTMRRKYRLNKYLGWKKCTVIN